VNQGHGSGRISAGIGQLSRFSFAMEVDTRHDQKMRTRMPELTPMEEKAGVVP
jgi:hypothetical protein